MMRNFGFVGPALLTLGLVAYACTSGEVVTGPATGSAGSGNPVGSAGTNGSGTAGTSANAGTNGSGRGGTVGAAGTTANAGTNGSGRGGTSAAGTSGSGRGGTSAAAGTFGQAGTTGSGTAGTQGSSSCPTTFDVAANGYAQTPSKAGCWHGYAFSYTETPTCGSTISPMNFSACTMPCTLMTSGTVNSATAANSYCGVVGVGFNIGQDASASTGSNVTPTGTGINVSFTESAGSNEFRINLVDASGMAWCFVGTASAGSAMVPYPSFKYQCWSGGAGTAYAKQPIASIAIQTIGGAANQAFTMTLKSVTEY